MRIFKWITGFVISFTVAWILIFTFTQQPFKQLVPARILTYWTPSIPIYVYVAGAFVIGLLVGLLVIFLNFISFQSKLHHKQKEIVKLQQELSQLRSSAEQTHATSYEPEFESENTETDQSEKHTNEPSSDAGSQV